MLNAPFLFAPLVIVVLYWIFRQPEQVFAGGRRRTAVKLIAFLYLFLALAPLLEGRPAFSNLFFVYPLGYAIFFRKRILSWLGDSARKGQVIWGVTFLLLWIQEIFVVLDYQGNIAGHLLAYAGYYVGIALVITLLRRWSLSCGQLFTIGGLWGVLLEQEFLGPKLLLAGDWTRFFWFAAFVYVVYGLYLAGPFLLFYEPKPTAGRPSRRRSLVYLAAIIVIPLLTWGLTNQLFGLVVPN